MAIPTKEPELVFPETQAVATRPAESALMFERLASDPNVDVTKLERLIEMQERIMRHQAKAEFDAAFSAMQGELPVINENGAILVNGDVRSKYAKYEDIQAAIRPILKEHGFSIRHRNEFLADGRLKIIGILSHRGGHSEQDEFECPADNTGGKSSIQAIGSTRSYGQRYTTIALLNIEARGIDDDGQAAGKKKAPAVKEPEGFQDWFADLAAVADEGSERLQAAWEKSNIEYRRHLTSTASVKWEDLKRKAKKVSSGR